jgi:hypothetical protein
MELLKGSTHLVLTVKSNLLGFRELLTQPEKNNAIDSIDAKNGGSRFAKNKNLHQIANGQGGRGSIPTVGAANGRVATQVSRS